MINVRRALLSLALGLLLAGGAGAHAQQASNTIGNPQLRDFSLEPRRQPPGQTILPGPGQAAPALQQPAQQQPVRIAPPPPTSAAPAQDAVTPVRRQPASQQPQAPAARAPQSNPQPETQQPQTQQPTGSVPSLPGAVPAPLMPDSVPAAPATEDALPAPAAAPGMGQPWLLYLLGGGMLLFGAVVLFRRRRPQEALAAPAAVPEIASAPAAPPAPRPDPVPRPWLELDLKSQRASFTATEAVIQFELSISNTGGSAARNLRIDVKMFNAGSSQDQEIGAFFKTAGRTGTKLNLPGIGPDSTGVIRGEVAMPLEEMRAVKLDGRMLFVPVIAVNALYDWGQGRTGHSAKSYIVGRELQESSERMGAFRVDQGPRIWRTVGQRPHTLAKRV